MNNANKELATRLAVVRCMELSTYIATHIAALEVDNETCVKKESKWSQPAPMMALRGCMAAEATLDNMLSYSSISADVTACEQQFSRLKNFLHDNTSMGACDFQSLLFPVFVHMYLELLGNGHKASAHKFFGRHSHVFKTEDTRLELLDQLSRLFSRVDILACKEVQQFRDLKYRVLLSRPAFDSLAKHLKNDDNTIMVQVFNQHIKLEVKTETSCSESLHEERPLDGQNQPVWPTVIPDNKVVRDDQALSALKQSITEVREGVPSLPSTTCYTFLNSYPGLCCASISANGEYLSAGFEDCLTRIWRLTPGLFPPMDVTDSPSWIYLSADYMDTGSPDMKSGQDQEGLLLKGHTGSVYQARFTCDSNLLLTCSDDTSVRLWDVEKQRNVSVYRGHNYPVWDLDTSEIGDCFVTCSHDQTARLWTTERAYPLRTFVGHSYDVDCVKFHPNNNYIATGSGDKTVRLWSMQEGKSVRLLHGHKSSVLALAFSPNGTYLASSGEDRRVRVWDLRTGMLYLELRGHTDTVYSLAFNQDSNVLASGGLDCNIRLWDLKKSPAQTTTLETHNSTELLGTFSTKNIPVVFLHYTRHNVLQMAGAV